MQHYMSAKQTLVLGVLLVLTQAVFGQLGNAVISYQREYEEKNNFFPHDHFMTTILDGLNDTTLSIKPIGAKLSITNKFSDGFSGHQINFVLSESLEILEARYVHGTDVIDGSESHRTVEKAILSFDKNPFENEFVTAHYTLQIKDQYVAGPLRQARGQKDTVTYEIFNGKFKVYSPEEIEKGKQWVIDQIDISRGTKDSTGLYIDAYTYAEFIPGREALEEILNGFELERSSTNVEKRNYVEFSMIVDESGRVNPESLTITDTMKTNELLEGLKSNQVLLSNWKPAVDRGEVVKSKVDLWVRIKK